ncbi:MAG TPA: hypothetical protein DHV15_00750 [Treponema sp.]|uniref:Uncharacterized protein n=1 Tax=Treponema denticola (strain ATCC 35405 / DSM 14222 / CIP 103919 / JCM 8153 / KCTC 15104) TaxID=243275 RepID=Q73P82_TREDE|nr:hypothetical protein TDE_0917 [Treponema denticola ATCC 35405]HCY94030.1 hypothetical protein [Treponema sp.]
MPLYNPFYNIIFLNSLKIPNGFIIPVLCKKTKRA